MEPPPACDVWQSVAQDDAQAVDRLLQSCEWIDVDAGNELGETLLHVAAARGHDATVRVLLRHRASLTSRDRVRAKSAEIPPIALARKC